MPKLRWMIASCLVVGLLAGPSLSGPAAAQDAVAGRIQAYLDQPQSTPALAQPIDGTVRRFYQRRLAQAAWRDSQGWSPRAYAAIEVLRHADQEGLDPADYRPDALAQALDHANAALVRDGAAIDPLALADIALSSAVLRYIRDASIGKLIPWNFDWDIPQERSDPAQLLATGLGEADITAWLARLPPQDPAYSGLRQMLARYRTLAGTPWPALPSGPSLRPGERDPRVADVAQMLATVGDLWTQPEQSGAERRDLVRLASVGSSLPNGAGQAGAVQVGTVYEGAVVEAVRRFQARHGLNPDGVLGEGTRLALNVSPDMRLAQIRANMERLRWMPRQMNPRFVRVNLPAFTLDAVENDKTVMSMPVVVGEPDWPTPIFADWVVSLKFAPNWTIPPKIARTETLPKIQQDPSYFNRLGLQVLRNGQVLNPAGIPWHRMSAQNFGYTLRQRPGKTNALGLIRFSLTNPYDIYLHDTPNQNAFRKDHRALSHGCVRVARPAELAAFVLNDPAWPAERVRATMDSAKSFSMTVPEPIPVFLTYFTAWQGQNGSAQFRSDIYDRDATLIAALR